MGTTFIHPIRTGMGIILLFQLTQPNANLWSVTAVNFAIPYWSISASLNILVTSMIVLRLLAIRSRTRAALSRYHARTYTSVAAMLIESAALYSCTALLFIITYARDSNIQNLVLPPLGQIQAISPLLIMWRVARGQAISREDFDSESGGPSALSWRRTAATSSSVGSALKWGNPKRSQTDSSLTAASNRRSNRGHTESGFSETQSVSLPPLPKEGDGPQLYEHKFAATNSALSDIEHGSWELDRVTQKGTFGSIGLDLDSPIDKEVDDDEVFTSREALRKMPSVQVIVERKVERWEER